MSADEGRRWTVKTCPACGSQVEVEYTHDGGVDVCKNMACNAYGPFAENPEPVLVEVAPVTELEGVVSEREKLRGEQRSAIAADEARRLPDYPPPS